MPVPRSLSSILTVINAKSLLIAALGVASTWLCLITGIKADFPLTLIATAIVFPLVFSISTAYARREKALEEYGAIKANGRSLYLASRDWLPTHDEGRDTRLKGSLHELLSACRDMCKSPIDKMPGFERRIYGAVGGLSQFASDMRHAKLASTECSRLNQYVSRIATAVENIRHIYEYRTPRTLRAFSNFFIPLLTVLYGPYFALQAEQFDAKLFFVMPILFALILVGLSNIQDHLENPFDQIGEDDVAINPDHFIATLDWTVAAGKPAG